MSDSKLIRYWSGPSDSPDLPDWISRHVDLRDEDVEPGTIVVCIQFPGQPADVFLDSNPHAPEDATISRDFDWVPTLVERLVLMANRHIPAGLDG